MALLYPELEYCLTCWEKLDPKVGLVIKRRWCSYPCAGMKPPHPDPAKWPRKCLTHRGYPKIKYLFPEQVNAQGGAMTYECSYCGYVHIGHRQVEAQERR